MSDVPTWCYKVSNLLDVRASVAALQRSRGAPDCKLHAS